MHENNFVTEEIIISAFNTNNYVAVRASSTWNGNRDFNRLNGRVGRLDSAI